MATEEIYLGGIASSELMVSGYPGNGIHATSTRLMLVRTRGAFGGNLAGLFGGGLLSNERYGKLSGPAAAGRIRDFEKRKYFEVSKENLRAIELKSPGSNRWSRLRIVPVSGEPVDVGISSVKDFEFVKELMMSFSPELVKVA